jgi:hypothetical protein
VAAQRLRTQGFDLNLFDVAVGASGGPKWLVLSALDRLLCELLQSRSAPIHLLGSSSGAWRFAGYCQPDSHRALSLLEEAYIEADWSVARPLAQRSQTALQILEAFLPPAHTIEIEPNKFFPHFIAAECQGLLASESTPIQMAGLLLALAVHSLKGRRALYPWVSRSLFSDPRCALPSPLNDIESKRQALTEQNYRQVLLASGSIPLVLPAIRDIAGASGVFRDGGLVDYHFDQLPIHSDGLILMPHFLAEQQLGWLERLVPSSVLPNPNLERLVIVCPTEAWVRSLPSGKLPDREDARQLTPELRRYHWHQSALRGQELAQEFSLRFEDGSLLDELKAF